VKRIHKRRQHSPAYLAETEKIKENKKKYGEKVHKFVAAEWTHPNGHPRCLMCGDEESISPECNREPTKAEYKAFQDKMDIEFPSRRLVMKAEHVPGTPYRYRHGWIPVGSTGKMHGGSGKRRLRTRREPGSAELGRRIAAHPEETARMRRVARENAEKHGVARRRGAPGISTPNPLGEAVSHGTPTEPKRGDSGPKRVTTRRGKTVIVSAKPRIIRNRKKVTLSQVARTELPGPAPMHLRNEAADYASIHYPKKEETYAGLIIRLAKKGQAQDPAYRGQQSQKYGIPVGRMIEIENEMHELMYPSAPTHRESASVRLVDMPEMQRNAIREHGARSASVYPDGRTRLVRAEKGPYKGKFLQLAGNGTLLGEISAEQAKKDQLSNKAYWKQEAEKQKTNPRRWIHEPIINAAGRKDWNSRLVTLPEWIAEKKKIEQGHADKEAQAEAKKAAKVKIAQQWAEAQGYDPDDSYWWGYYWNDPSLIKTQDDAVTPTAAQPVGGAPIRRAPRRAKKKVVLSTPEISQKEMRGHRPGPKRDIKRGEDLQQIADEAAKQTSRQRRKIQKLDPFRYIIKAEHVPGTPYHFRHGWIPVDGIQEVGSRRRAGTVTRMTGATRGGGVFDHKTKTVADKKMISRPQRGSTHVRPGVKSAYSDPGRAIYDRNNGTTKISDKRLKEIFEDPSKMTVKEKAMIGSATASAKLDGEKTLSVKTSRGPRELARYNVISQIRSKISPGSGDRSTKSTNLSETVRAGKNAKRRESGKPSAPEMERIAKQVIEMWSTDGGRTVTCVHCNKSMGARGISLETPLPKELGGNYRDIPGIWPSHHKCNSAAGNKGISVKRSSRKVSAQQDPQTYVEEMMRRFDRLPPEVKQRLPEVYKKFRKYLGPYPYAKSSRTRRAA
jgi:hypothetical protein